MNAKQTQKFLETIVRFGSISHAAKHLYISQPYLSKVIKDLEKELGVELIDRESNPLVLTYAGERYLQYTNQIVHITREMEYELQDIANLEKGRLKIGVNPFLASHMLYNILPEFIKTYPGIKVELIEDNANQIEELLAEHQIDISITILPIDHEDIDYEILYEEPLHLAVPAAHPLAQHTQISSDTLPFDIDKLNGKKFILLKRNMTLRTITDAFLEKNHLQVQPVMETINIDNALYLVGEGLGMTLVPNSAKLKQPNTKAVYFELDPNQYKNTVAVAYHKKTLLSKAAQAFLNLAIIRFKAF